MIIKVFSVGAFGTNCYLIKDKATDKIAIIDPGDNAKLLTNEINSMGGNLIYIFLTHSHTDHTGAVNEIAETFNAPIYISEKDEALTLKPSILFSKISKKGKADGYLFENKILELGDLNIKCIETPGHTPGGISFLVDNYLFSGDTLFKDSIGRTDFPGGDYEEIISSIKNKILILPEETIVLPGHGPKTTVEYEKQFNPFVN